MSDFASMLSRLKTVLSSQYSRRKIKDKEVAEALGLTPEYFAVIKKRNKIPYEALVRYCLHHRISLNWLLGGQTPRRCSDDKAMLQ
jgi:DNA-binding Xre family transcriptional regulator